MTEEFDLCKHCCGWVNDMREKSPATVCDGYPRMMRTVLKTQFHMGKRASREFIEDACCGNWLKLHETDVERETDAEAYARMLLHDVWYCSDRWSWDRVLRIQWLYQRVRYRVEVDDD